MSIKKLFTLCCFLIAGFCEADQSMEPRIVDLKEFTVVGMQTFGNPAAGDFSKMWAALFNCAEKIPNVSNKKVSYGVGSYTKEHFLEDKWFYMAAREVTDLSKILPQMSGKIIPKNKYAVFKYQGSISPKLAELFQYIYKEWLPSSDYVLAGPYDFERYGDQYLGSKNENSVFEIYVPIKNK